MTPENMSDPSAQLASAEVLLSTCNMHSAGSPLLVAAAQVRVMIAQALIALDANRQVTMTAGNEGPPRVVREERIGGKPAEPERMDPAIIELLDRAADLLGDEARPRSREGDASWEKRSEQWMTDWRAYLHATYHRRQPW